MLDRIAALEARIQKLEALTGVAEREEVRKLRDSLVEVCLEFGFSYLSSKKMGRTFFNDGYTPDEVRAILIRRGAKHV